MITEFKGDHNWLSNFVDVSIKLEGIGYRSVEHAYMSAKSDNPEWKRICANPIFNAVEIKKAGRKVDLVPDWEERKMEVMRNCLWQKFNTEPFRSLLISTGNTEIQEGNWWNDKFWGVCLKTGKGENNLGKMIMQIRSNLE